MSESAAGKILEGAKEPLAGAMKGGVVRKIGWAGGVVLIILLGWRFRTQLAGLLYRIPVLGGLFATIAGDTSQGVA